MCPVHVCIHIHQTRKNALTHKPSLHILPLHPIAHVQVSGWEQVPPFWQGGVHLAEEQNESGHQLHAK